MNQAVMSQSERAMRDTLEAVVEIFLRRDHAGAQLRLALVGTALAIYWLVLGLVFDFPRVLPSAWVDQVVFPANVILDLITSLFAPQVLLHFIPVAAGLWLGFRLGSHYLADLFELESPVIAARYLQAAVFGLGYDTLKIAHGEMERLNRNSPLFRIGGPGYLQVNLGFAAVLESVEGAPRIYGAEGRRFIEGFDRLRDVVDLRDQLGQLDEVQAVTADGVVVQARDVQMVFRVFGGGRARTLQSPYPYAEEGIRRLVYGRPVSPEGEDRWRDVLGELARNEIQAFVRGLTLQSFLALQPESNATEGTQPPSRFHIPRRELTERFHTAGAQERLRAQGLEIDWVGVGTWEVGDPAGGEGELGLAKAIIDAWRDRQRAERLASPDYLNRQAARGYRRRAVGELRRFVDAWDDSELGVPPRCWAALRHILARLEIMAAELRPDQDSETFEVVGPVLDHLKGLTEPRTLGG